MMGGALKHVIYVDVKIMFFFILSGFVTRIPSPPNTWANIKENFTLSEVSTLSYCQVPKIVMNSGSQSEAPAAIFLVRISAKTLSISENFCQISV